jgi:hypothetical protein
MAQTDRPPTDRAIQSVRRLIALKQGKNAQTGRAASALFKWIRSEGIDQDETPEDEISEHFEDDENLQDIRWIDVLRSLADEDSEKRLGRFLVGRHGHKTRFAWHGGSSLDVACKVLGESPCPPRNGPTRSNATQSATNPRGVSIHKIGRFEIRLPRDAAPEEYAEVIEFLVKQKGT